MLKEMILYFGGVIVGLVMSYLYRKLKIAKEETDEAERTLS